MSGLMLPIYRSLHVESQSKLLDVLRNNISESKLHEFFINEEELSRSVSFELHAFRTAKRSIYRWAWVEYENMEDDIHYHFFNAITFNIELRFGEQQKCACNLRVLIPTILCYSGEIDASEQ